MTDHTEPQQSEEALRDLAAAELVAARERTTLLTTAVDDSDLVRQHSPLMSPLVWDLAHVANQEELWLLRAVGGRDPLHPEIDPLYDAFEHPRAERPSLPLLTPAEARSYGHEVRGRVLDLIEKVKLPAGMYLEWSGTFEHQVRAQKTLRLVFPAVIATIMLILYLTHKSWTDAFLMMTSVLGAFDFERIVHQTGRDV